VRLDDERTVKRTAHSVQPDAVLDGCAQASDRLAGRATGVLPDDLVAIARHLP
jgi:hypothetical protein